MPPRKKPAKHVAEPAAEPVVANSKAIAGKIPAVATPGDPLPKGGHGPRRTLKKRKAKTPGDLYAIMVQLLPADIKKLAAIDEEFLCDSDSRASRIALMRWHRHLTRLSQRPGWAPPDRPEFAVTASPASGGRQTKLYCTAQDMARFEELFILTGRKGLGQQVRAAIGWLYENLD